MTKELRDKIREELDIEKTVSEEDLDEMEKWFKEHGPSDEEIEYLAQCSILTEEEEREIALNQEQYDEALEEESEVEINSIER